MITDGEKWDYLTAKSFSRLLHGISSNHSDDHHGMNVFIHSEQRINLSHLPMCATIIIL